ncbi:sulfonate transport system substrate-binding protein [Pseudobutyrivibrio sp. YE44]|uniref:ABC transporter substrate-binding protein n=1 Tax=Pseudobutyrivibrio sp. YE44 TaxID=1520802 RepID=UPI00088A34A7|nr:aliphatic sulfonate ABC transporter substrate-binding protein [Pseudobutyrivibrio sp. YE44]SDB14764.1 sulfonate transport system substrate-binding protein [Pseudobutyrivibrio sp. YE44]
MKKLAMLLLSAVVSIGVVGCGTTSSSTVEANEKIEVGSDLKDDTVIRVGRQPGDLLANIAEHNGYFEEEGLTIDTQVFSYGPPIIEALTAGDLDIGFMGDQPAFSAISNGVDIEIISKTRASDKLHGLLARNDSGIETLADLKGKKVSVPFGSNAQPLLYIYLDSVGLTEDDVEILNLGVADGVTSLLAGDIDAAIVWEPHFRAVAEKEDSIHVVANAEGYKQYVSITVDRAEFGKEHPDLVAKYLKALDKAAKWSVENPEEAAQIIKDIDDVDVDTTYKTIIDSEISVGIDSNNINALVEGEQQSFTYGLIEKDFDITEYINTDYLELANIK